MPKAQLKYKGSAGPNAHNRPKVFLFHKMRPAQLADMLEPTLDHEESIYKLERDEVASCVPSVYDLDAPPAEASDALILDVRSFEEYTECHVHGAMHYDLANLGKATNQFPRELYFYRGPEKRVVLYDADGLEIAKIANLFVEKGVDNATAIAGGYAAIRKRCPHILDPVPAELDEAPPPTLAEALKRCHVERHDAAQARTPLRRLHTAGSVHTAVSARTQNTRLSSIAGSIDRSQLKPWRM